MSSFSGQKLVSVKEDVIKTGTKTIDTSNTNISMHYKILEEASNNLTKEMSGDTQQSFVKASNEIGHQVLGIMITLTNLSNELLTFSTSAYETDSKANMSAGGNKDE